MAIAFKSVKFPEMGRGMKIAMHQAYYHSSLLLETSNFSHHVELIKETPLLKWYKCKECGEFWREHKYDDRWREQD